MLENSNINLCNRFEILIYLCYITVYAPLCNIEDKLRNKLYTYILCIGEAEIVNKDDNNDSDDKESGGTGDDDDDDDDDDV